MNWFHDKQRLEHIDRATADFIQTATGTKFDIDDNEEVINVCRAWENSMNKAKKEGHNDGVAEMSVMVANAMLRDNKPIEEIIKYSQLPEDRILELAQQLNQ